MSSEQPSISRATAKRLLDARLACDEILAYSNSVNRPAFLNDRTLQIVVAHLTQTIGEALRQAEHLYPPLGGYITDLHDIIDTRHRIVHGYDQINYQLLWDVVQTDLPILASQLNNLLAHAPSSALDPDQAADTDSG